MQFLFKKLAILSLVLSCLSCSVKAQFLMDMVDTTTEMGKGILSIYKQYNGLRFSGYVQPQYQVIQTKGAKSFNGGDFPPNVDNRFMIRRGRLRVDYVRFSDNKSASGQFVFQIDATERGVFVRDLWGRVFENRAKLFSLTVGMFARPFGYELNLSSSDRESPERGRMSQILMKTERDLGAMVSFEPRERTTWLKYIDVDAGFFNGPGLTAPADYDSYKDFISRAVFKRYPLNNHLLLSAGASYFNGGFIQNDKYSTSMQGKGGQYEFVFDSSAGNTGRKLPRKYNGFDAQLKWLHKSNSATELRGEYWWGTQTASKATSETPSAVLTNEYYYTRKFDGAFFYLLHSLDRHNQVGVKFDWYDPNTLVKEKEIGNDNGTTATDIKYNTFGIGYIYYFDANFKLVAWYEFVKNESTLVSGYTGDLKDNILTLRLQFRF